MLLLLLLPLLLLPLLLLSLLLLPLLLLVLRCLCVSSSLLGVSLVLQTLLRVAPSAVPLLLDYYSPRDVLGELLPALQQQQQQESPALAAFFVSSHRAAQVAGLAASVLASRAFRPFVLYELLQLAAAPAATAAAAGQAAAAAAEEETQSLWCMEQDIAGFCCVSPGVSFSVSASVSPLRAFVARALQRAAAAAGSSTTRQLLLQQLHALLLLRLRGPKGPDGAPLAVGPLVQQQQQQQQPLLWELLLLGDAEAIDPRAAAAVSPHLAAAGAAAPNARAAAAAAGEKEMETAEMPLCLQRFADEVSAAAASLLAVNSPLFFQGEKPCCCCCCCCFCCYCSYC